MKAKRAARLLQEKNEVNLSDKTSFNEALDLEKELDTALYSSERMKQDALESQHMKLRDSSSEHSDSSDSSGDSGSSDSSDNSDSSDSSDSSSDSDSSNSSDSSAVENQLLSQHLSLFR